ncbi:ATP-binding protein [Enterococcus faecalis]|uniref:ATP-binding protein n=1 Tax=Enterococcus faecalis TaxID=1351 RepID=UPI00076FD2DC|nr:ATP-binding protein [Enterococcus faecalis]
MIRIDSPLKALKENMLLNDRGHIWAYYRVEPKTISQNNPKAVQETKEMMVRLMRMLEPYKDVDLTMYPKTLNLRNKMKKIGEGFDPKNPGLGEYYAKETISVLEQELGTVYRSSFLLGVKMRDGYIADDIRDVIKRISEEISVSILEMFGYEVSNQDVLFEMIQQTEKELRQLLFSYSIRPLSENDMIYANRAQYIRGIKHNIDEENHWKTIEDIQSSVLTPLNRGKGILKLEDDLDESYIAILPIGETVENMKNINLFHYCQDLRFPVELRMKIHYPETKGVNGLGAKLGWLNNRFKEEELEQISDGDESSNRMKKIRFLVQNIRKKIDEKEPVVDWLCCFIVYGKTAEEVREHSVEIIKSLNDTVKVYKGKRDQINLFHKMIMGQDLEGQRHWVQRTSLECIGELMFATIEELGMESGWYIGRQDVLGSDGIQGEKTPLEDLIFASNRYVFLNPLAIAEGIKGALYDAPHIAVTGKTGKGKTFLVGLLFLYSSFLDIQSLFIDPKGEKRYWFTKIMNDPYYQKHYPQYVDHLRSFNYVSLDARNKENFGVLDPITYLTRNDAKQVSQDMINELNPLGANFQLKGAVLEAIEAIQDRKEQGEIVGLMHVIDYLKDHSTPEIAEYGNFLSLTIQDSILRLGFSYGENKGLDFNEKVTILEIQDLKLPSKDQDASDYTDVDRKALCLMVSLGRFCEMFGKRDLTKKTAVYFTEAWVFSKSNSGRAIITAMARVGRSQMNQLVLDTQFIDDLGSEAEKGNYGVVFAFDEDSEREKILSHLDLEINKENLNEMRHMIKGQCWMRDPYGRVGKLNVHSPFEEVTKSLQTTIKTSNSEAEELVA